MACSAACLGLGRPHGAGKRDAEGVRRAAAVARPSRAGGAARQAARRRRAGEHDRASPRSCGGRHGRACRSCRAAAGAGSWAGRGARRRRWCVDLPPARRDVTVDAESCLVHAGAGATLARVDAALGAARPHARPRSLDVRRRDGRRGDRDERPRLSRRASGQHAGAGPWPRGRARRTGRVVRTPTVARALDGSRAGAPARSGREGTLGIVTRGDARRAAAAGGADRRARGSLPSFDGRRVASASALRRAGVRSGVSRGRRPTGCRPAPAPCSSSSTGSAARRGSTPSGRRRCCCAARWRAAADGGEKAVGRAPRDRGGAGRATRRVRRRRIGTERGRASVRLRARRRSARRTRRGCGRSAHGLVRRHGLHLDRGGSLALAGAVLGGRDRAARQLGDRRARDDRRRSAARRRRRAAPWSTATASAGSSRI